MAMDNVLTDLVEPHLSEMEVVPVSLSPHREQRSRAPKMIQPGAQLQTKRNKREMKEWLGPGHRTTMKVCERRC